MDGWNECIDYYPPLNKDFNRKISKKQAILNISYFSNNEHLLVCGAR